MRSIWASLSLPFEWHGVVAAALSLYLMPFFAKYFLSSTFQISQQKQQQQKGLLNRDRITFEAIWLLNLLWLFTISAHLHSTVCWLYQIVYTAHMENESNSSIQTGFAKERESLSFFSMNVKRQFQCRCRCFIFIFFFIKNYNHFTFNSLIFWKLVKLNYSHFHFPLYFVYFCFYRFCHLFVLDWRWPNHQFRIYRRN